MVKNKKLTENELKLKFYNVFGVETEELKTKEGFIKLLRLNRSEGDHLPFSWINDYLDHSVIDSEVVIEMVKSRVTWGLNTILGFIPSKLITKDLIKEVILNHGSLNVLKYKSNNNYKEVSKLFDKELFDLSVKEGYWNNLPKKFADESQIMEKVMDFNFDFNFKGFEDAQNIDFSKIIIEFFKYRADSIKQLDFESQIFIKENMTSELYDRLINMGIYGLETIDFKEFIRFDSLRKMAKNMYNFPNILNNFNSYYNNVLSTEEKETLMIDYLESFGFKRIKGFSKNYITSNILEKAKKTLTDQEDEELYKYYSNFIKM